jgi:hypothetical protein
MTVKLNQLVTFNAILFIALGIAFALYGPLMIAFFGILETEGSPVMYWYAASFARMLGAALFAAGFLLFALRRIQSDPALSGKSHGFVLALVISYGLGFIVALTQQVSIWGNAAGLITSGIFLVLLAGYGYFLIRSPQRP